MTAGPSGSLPPLGRGSLLTAPSLGCAGLGGPFPVPVPLTCCAGPVSAQAERFPGAAVQPGRAEALPEHQHHQRAQHPLQRRGRPRGAAQRHRAGQPAALLRPPGTWRPRRPPSRLEKAQGPGWALLGWSSPSCPPQSGACTFAETVLCELGNPFKRNQRVSAPPQPPPSPFVGDGRWAGVQPSCSTVPPRCRQS